MTITSEEARAIASRIDLHLDYLGVEPDAELRGALFMLEHNGKRIYDEMENIKELEWDADRGKLKMVMQNPLRYFDLVVKPVTPPW